MSRPRRRATIALPAAVAGALLVICPASRAGQTISIDDARKGLVFEGLGALSAGASSRLLIDYPEPERSHVLDYLFRPKFGAGFQHFKVEIGGDVNSTDGSEPSHARTREELASPRREHCERGYEWWLMREAAKRNPDMILDCLEWGAPGWLGREGEDARRRFYSADNAEYVAAFIRGAKEHHGLTIRYTGVWNERQYDMPWIKLLRKTLDARGLADVRIVAADACSNQWRIAEDMARDPGLLAAVAVVGEHYPERIEKRYSSTSTAQGLGRPLWNSEGGPWRGDWAGAADLARIYNRCYIEGRMTKTVIWSLVSSYYDVLSLPDSGVMRAREPWSGHYEVQPAVWAVAHTTQFAEPGWRYADSGCGYLDGGGSFVTLAAPGDAGDYSVIVETMDARAAQTVGVRLPAGLSPGPLSVWRSVRDASEFVRQPDVVPAAGGFKVTLEPRAIYSLTTTRGQRKGEAPAPPPMSRPFPFPYSERFEGYALRRTPRYLSDHEGAFEVARRPGGPGQCLEQVITRKGIEWERQPFPMTYAGDRAWADCEVAADARVPEGGFAVLAGRIESGDRDKVNGVWFRIDSSGRWDLNDRTRRLASGERGFRADEWHGLRLRFSGPVVIAEVDDKEVARAVCRSRSGLAGLGCGYHLAWFDDLEVAPFAGPAPDPPETANLAFGKKAAASSVWDANYGPEKANDLDGATRWNSADGRTAGEWLEIDLGREVTFNRTVLTQFADRITGYRIEYWDGAAWRDACSGGRLGTEPRTDAFPAVRSAKVRLLIVSTNGETPSIFEMEVLAPE